MFAQWLQSVVPVGGDLFLLGLERQRAIPIPINDIGMRLPPVAIQMIIDYLLL